MKRGVFWLSRARASPPETQRLLSSCFAGRGQEEVTRGRRSRFHALRAAAGAGVAVRSRPHRDIWGRCGRDSRARQWPRAAARLAALPARDGRGCRAVVGFGPAMARVYECVVPVPAWTLCCWVQGCQGMVTSARCTGVALVWDTTTVGEPVGEPVLRHKPIRRRMLNDLL